MKVLIRQVDFCESVDTATADSIVAVKVLYASYADLADDYCARFADPEQTELLCTGPVEGLFMACEDGDEIYIPSVSASEANKLVQTLFSDDRLNLTEYAALYNPVTEDLRQVKGILESQFKGNHQAFLQHLSDADKTTMLDCFE